MSKVSGNLAVTIAWNTDEESYSEKDVMKLIMDVIPEPIRADFFYFDDEAEISADDFEEEGYWVLLGRNWNNDLDEH